MQNAGKRILVIEDDQDMQHAIRAMLEPVGYTLSCCSTGPAGLAAMRHDPPDLVLLDIMLATPSEGFHIAYEMRRDDVLKHIPIVMVSAIGERTGMDFSRELGTEYVPADAFLNKPLESKTLRQTIEQVFSRREAERGAGSR